MTEPTAEHLKVAQEWLEKHGGSLEGPVASQSYGWVEVSDENVASLAALLASREQARDKLWLEKANAAFPEGHSEPALNPTDLKCRIKDVLLELSEAEKMVAELVSRERALREAIDRIREHWPHIEVGIKGRTHDPGSPTCLRCTIEKEIADAGAV